MHSTQYSHQFSYCAWGMCIYWLWERLILSVRVYRNTCSIIIISTLTAMLLSDDHIQISYVMFYLVCAHLAWCMAASYFKCSIMLNDTCRNQRLLKRIHMLLLLLLLIHARIRITKLHDAPARPNTLLQVHSLGTYIRQLLAQLVLIHLSCRISLWSCKNIAISYIIAIIIIIMLLLLAI